MNDIMTMIPVYVMGRKYEIPKGLTILKALEYSGYRIIRGCGCRGGVCGACATVYRKKGSYRLSVGLACQTVVEPHMDLAPMPYIPATKALYRIKEVPFDASSILQYYPEIARCVACNTCTKSCPMGLDVMNCIAAAIRGDFKKVVDLSMECIMCGLCAARCPAEISPFNVTLLIRRIYGRHAVPPSSALQHRLKEIRTGAFDDELDTLKNADMETLKERYQAFQATRGASV